MTILKRNNIGINVALLQIRLGLIPTFYFDDDTHQAVMKFQKVHNLKVDGEVGLKTRAALNLKPVDGNIPINPHKDWLTIARTQIGVTENRLMLPFSLQLPWRDSPDVMDYHSTTDAKDTNDETAWCSSFVNWVITKSGRKGTDRAMAKSWLTWEHGVEVTTPQEGDLVIIRNALKDRRDPDTKGNLLYKPGYHVGFFISRNKDKITILGGNQGEEGKASVNETNYLLAQENDPDSVLKGKYVVKGYRRPRARGNAAYLKLGNIKGSVTAKGYEGQIQILTWNLGMERTVLMEPGNLSNRESGRPSLSPIALTLLADSSIASLLKESLTGAAGREAMLSVVRTGSILQETVKLDHVMVASYAMKAHSDYEPLLGLRLGYSRIETSRTDTDASGKPGSPMRVAYNVDEARLA